MDQSALVIDRLSEARKLIDRLSQEQNLVVAAAFWMNSLDDETWSLHLVAPKINEIGKAGAYLALVLTLERHPEIRLEVNHIRPHRTDDPIVVEALEFIRLYPAAEVFRLGGVFLQGHFIQRAYLFPVLLDGKTGTEIRGESLSVG